MNFIQLLMKRPSDIQIRYAKIILWVFLIFIGIIAFWVENLKIENSVFGFSLNETAKNILAYWIIGLWVIPLLLWGLDINILSRGYTRIIQMFFWVLLLFVSGLFIETATLSVDIFYFLIGLVVFFAGLTGKAITRKGLKAGQKITKIRV